jgi:hypothetical protein
MSNSDWIATNDRQNADRTVREIDGLRRDVCIQQAGRQIRRPQLLGNANILCYFGTAYHSFLLHRNLGT